jgi:hypothetical protein
MWRSERLPRRERRAGLDPQVRALLSDQTAGPDLGGKRPNVTADSVRFRKATRRDR